MLGKQRAQIKKILIHATKEKNKFDAMNEEMSSQFTSLQSLYSDVCNEKDRLEVELNNIKERYNEVTAMHRETSSNEAQSTAEKRQVKNLPCEIGIICQNYV